MRKLIIAALMAAAATSFAQGKTDTAKKAKPVYDYFVKVPVRNYQQLLQIAQQLGNAVKYNSLINDKDSRAIQINIEKYLFDLPKSVKLDSVIVKK